MDGILSVGKCQEVMVYWKDNHGNIYGPFSKQEDGSPNAGEVVRFYREQMGLSQKALAMRVGVTRIQVIQMEHHNKVPQSLSRRRALADLLKIPPVLLGVSVVGSETFLNLVEVHSDSRRSAVTPYSIQEASEYLDAAWDLHRFTGSLNMLPGVQRQKARIEEQVSGSGPALQANLELLNRYEQFLMVVGRNLQDYTASDPRNLINAARQIDTPDVLAISLYKRGRMYFQQQRYDEALRDIRETLALAEHAGPAVRGYTLGGAGPILAYRAKDKADICEVLALFDEAQKYIDRAKGSPDPFHFQFNESAYFLQRAESITSLLRLDPSLLDEALEALDLAQERTPSQHIERRSKMERLYADALYQVGDYAPAVAAALECLDLAQSIHLVHHIEDIQKLYEKLFQTKLKGSAELRELRLALAKK